jgi:hypothetical protein
MQSGLHRTPARRGQGGVARGHPGRVQARRQKKAARLPTPCPYVAHPPCAFRLASLRLPAANPPAGAAAPAETRRYAPRRRVAALRVTPQHVHFASGPRCKAGGTAALARCCPAQSVVVGYGRSHPQRTKPIPPGPPLRAAPNQQRQQPATKPNEGPSEGGAKRRARSTELT